jgi:aryl-alcohol dehydrogenase-like predicted oxidoreductase
LAPTVQLAPGFATAEGTGRYRRLAEERRRVAPGHFRKVGGGLHLSSLGLGTYLGRPDSVTDTAVEQAVSICVDSGRVNVLDTAINYRYQRAERSVGRALARMLEASSLSRDEVFVATKIGYLAPDGESGLTAQDWVQRELIAPGVLAPEDIVGGSHSMTPNYLRDQIDRSRANLGLETLDLLYLHNAAESQLGEVEPAEFRRRLSVAFAELERLRATGALRFYGLATWDSFRVPPDRAGYVALESIVALAREVAGDDHGFRFIQFPFNLAMPEAATLAVQPVAGRTTTLFQAAADLGIGCFTSVPLMQGRLARARGPASAQAEAVRALQFARSAPGTIAPLVGQKTAEHLSSNLAVASEPPWSRSKFDAALR